MIEPYLSIVTVNVNGLADTLRCLESLYASPPGLIFEALVVDNYEMESVAIPIKQQYSNVTVIPVKPLQGFSKNYNLGIRQARGKYVLVLNNDTVLHPGALEVLIQALETHPKWGMVGPRLVSVEGVVQSSSARRLPSPFAYIAFLLFLDPGFPTGRLWERWQQRRLERRATGPVPCISGAAMLVRRAELDQVGLLDEGFDFYFEDVEWCHRYQRRGFQVAYVAESIITHLGDQSLSKVREWAKQSEYRSAIRYFRQYYVFPAWKHGLVWLAAVLGFGMRAIALKLVQWVTGRSGFADVYVRLTRWVWSQQPGRSQG